MDVAGIVRKLNGLGNPEAVAGMSRVGIAPDKAWGVSIPQLRRLARELGKNHKTAQALWKKKIRETMILAAMIDDPGLLTETRMEAWVLDFYDWEVCDQCCANLFEKNPLAWSKAVEWSGRPEEFVKRAGFVLMARLAVSDKKADDERFEPFLPLIVAQAGDDRNMVKKAVNWALRQIGKRNLNLNKRAVETARQINRMDAKAARWVAADALRELTSDAVRERLKKKSARGK